jgi:hypothetical protein
MKIYARAVAGAVIFLGAALAARAQTITLGQLACLPLEGNGALNATVSPETPGTTTRLYFRRMNDTVEDFYFVEMEPAGSGGYWATFPVPTDDKASKRELKNYQYEGKTIAKNNHPWAEWWRAKEGSSGRNPNGDLDNARIQERASLGKTQQRAWMAGMDDAALQSWLDRQTTEPAEYYVAVVDAAGKPVATSPIQSVEIKQDCRVSLTPQQQGYAKNLTVGESAAWQAEEEVFHWECDGVVSRRNNSNVLRADDRCRGCIVAWWPAAAAAGAVALIGIVEDDPIDISPSRP